MAKQKPPVTSAAYASQPPTPQMQAVGLSFGDVVDYAQQAVDILQKHGDAAVGLLRTGFKLWVAISGRDFLGIMTELNKAVVDVQALIKAIQDEFGV